MSCSICLEGSIQAPLEQFGLDCGHSACRECLATFAAGEVAAKRVPVVCFARGCAAAISHAALRGLLGGADLDRLDRAEVEAAIGGGSNLRHCPTPGCEGVFEVVPPLRTLACTLCRRRSCVDCRADAHDGACPAGEEALLAVYAVSTGAKRCPRCATFVEKTAGCNHMTCRCGEEFCYLCGCGIKGLVSYHFSLGCVQFAGSRPPIFEVGARMIGDIGPMGVRGEMGATGPTGPTGAGGVIGRIGPVGLRGEMGATGPIAPAWLQGRFGSIGSTGAQGPPGPSQPRRAGNTGARTEPAGGGSTSSDTG